MRTFLLIFVASSFVLLAAASPARASAAAVGPPSGSILSPADGAVIPFGTDITFSGDGSDSDGTPLVRGQLYWTSSQNGFLGTGPWFQRNSSTMSAGSHTIQLLLTGNNFQQSWLQVTIWIGPPPTSTPTNSPTATSTNTPTPTDTPTPTSTNTPTATNTPTSTPTATNTPTNTPTATNTPTNTPPPKATTTSTPTPTSTPGRGASRTATPPHRRPCADFNRDGHLGGGDVALIVHAVAHHSRDLRFDVNGDGRVDWGDVWATIRQLGRGCHGAPPR